jgi:hypothetical protein
MRLRIGGYAQATNAISGRNNPLCACDYDAIRLRIGGYALGNNPLC